MDAAELSTSALFRRVRKGDHISNDPPDEEGKTKDRLTTEGARQQIKAIVRQAGVEGVSGHNLRIGTTQELAAEAESLVELQHAGRWESPKIPDHCLEHNLLRRA